jgi:tetratricopeptide (TPR) repeat protein
LEAVMHAENRVYEEWESCYLRAIEMSESTGNLLGVAAMKSNMSAGYGEWGQINKALKVGQEALQIAVQADDLYLKSNAYTVCGEAFFKKGLFLEAEENLALGIEMGRKTNFIAALGGGLQYLALLQIDRGRFREAEECIDGFIALMGRTRIYPSGVRVLSISKAAIGVALGRIDPDLDAALIFDLQEVKRRSMQGMVARDRGQIYLIIDDKHMDVAEAWIRKAIEINEQNRMPWHLARDYALYADFFKKKADPAQAKEKLGKAIDLMRSIGADGWVKKYEEELAGL